MVLYFLVAVFVLWNPKRRGELLRGYNPVWYYVLCLPRQSPVPFRRMLNGGETLLISLLGVRYSLHRANARECL